MSAATRAVLVGVIVLVLLGGFVATRLLNTQSTLEKAISKLEDNKAFSSSAKAGQTVADISASLRKDGAACRKRGDDVPRCSALLSASAYAAVTAFTLLDCTAPGVYDGRQTMLRYMRAVRAFLDNGAKSTLPSIPRVVTC